MSEVKEVAKAIVESAIPDGTLRAQLEKLLKERNAAQREAAKPKEPDWANITEASIGDPTIYIPVIDHDVPDYMNIKLKDQEYVPVWANKDQRRVGQLQAEGYELLKQEHVHPDFKLPLKFGSDGTYEYLDVICFRVHKRILFSKRRKALEISQKQLKNTNRPPKTRYSEEDDIQLESGITIY